MARYDVAIDITVERIFTEIDTDIPSLRSFSGS